jgi:hypothetical protein
MVAKAHKHTEDAGARQDFHKTFYLTQLKSKKMAEIFNHKLKPLLQLRHIPTSKIAQIKFLECSVYKFPDDKHPCGVLVEEMLENKNWTKWNGNNGYVHGGAPNGHQAIAALVDGMANLDLLGSGETCARTGFLLSDFFQMGLDGFLQAFSHFTYIESRRKYLVCDLQGALAPSTAPGVQPVFQLTDPVIHYASSKGRKYIYGRTDHGKKGFSRFFQSHKCNAICGLLSLGNQTSTSA